MDFSHVLGNGGFLFVLNFFIFEWKFNLVEESVCDIDKSISWPVVEPIHGCTVDDSWEHSSPDSEGIADWGEAQADMEVLPCLVKEEIKELIWSVLVSSTLGLSSNLAEDGIELILDEQLWDPTRGEEIVEKDEESIVSDLGICHDK